MLIVIFGWRIHDLVNTGRKILISFDNQRVELEGIYQNVQSFKVDYFGSFIWTWCLGWLLIIQVSHDDFKHFLIFWMSLLHDGVEYLSELA